MRWRLRLWFLMRSMAAIRASFLYRLPSRMWSSIWVMACMTVRPAPRLRCPTSELPINPSGRPTARPEVSRVVWAQLAQMRSIVGVLARATALWSRRGFSPQPSRMMSATNRWLVMVVIICRGGFKTARPRGCPIVGAKNLSPLQSSARENIYSSHSNQVRSAQKGFEKTSCYGIFLFARKK